MKWMGSVNENIISIPTTKYVCTAVLANIIFLDCVVFQAVMLLCLKHTCSVAST